MQAHTQKRANLSIGGMKNQHYSILIWNQQVTLDKYIRSFDWIRGSNNSAVLTSIYAFPCLYAYIQKSLCTVTHARTQTIANWRTHMHKYLIASSSTCIRLYICFSRSVMASRSIVSSRFSRKVFYNIYSTTLDSRSISALWRRDEKATPKRRRRTIMFTSYQNLSQPFAFQWPWDRSLIRQWQFSKANWRKNVVITRNIYFTPYMSASGFIPPRRSVIHLAAQNCHYTICSFR